MLTSPGALSTRLTRTYTPRAGSAYAHNFGKVLQRFRWAPLLHLDIELDTRASGSRKASLRPLFLTRGNSARFAKKLLHARSSSLSDCCNGCNGASAHHAFASKYHRRVFDREAIERSS